MGEVAFGLLGPLQVLVDDVDVTPSAPKERALLAMLAIEPGQVVPADRLIDELWPELSPDKGRRVLQVRVAGVRKQLQDAGAPTDLEFTARGYRLRPVPSCVDARTFVDLAAAGRRLAELDDARAAALLRQALELWRGDALADVHTCLTLEAEAARLDEARLAATEDLMAAELRCGHHDAVLPELERLTLLHPLRERLWHQKVLALYRGGRQVEALRACRSIRQRLVDDMGVTPGPALRTLETDILAQRGRLDWSPATPVPLIADLDDVPMPAVQYATAPDGVHLAYQVIGDGPIDILVIPGFISHLETWWEAHAGRLVRELARLGRLILFDKRGTGLSDRPGEVTAEQWIDDVDVVLDAVGAEEAVVVGVSAGGSLAAWYTARRPDRVWALAIYGGFARIQWAPDYPLGVPPEETRLGLASMESRWGQVDQFDPVTGVDWGLTFYCPSAAADPAAQEHWARFQRVAVSPSAAVAYAEVAGAVDVRELLGQIRAPTLVLHATRDPCVPIDHARYLADHIRGGRLVELDTADHIIWFSEAIDEIAAALQGFLTGCGSRSQAESAGA